MSDYAAAKSKSLELLAAGDARGAFNEFRWQLEYPGKVEPRQFAEALTTLAQISAKITGPDWAAHVHRAARRPNDVQALFDCGYQLIEQSLHGIAATVLLRAHKLDPAAEGVLSELTIALEGAGLNAEACRVLRGAPDLLRESSTCRYLLAFNTLMTADIDGARREIERVRVPAGNDNAAIMVGNVRDMLARADAIRDVTPLNDTDLRGWHAVVTGSLLLHLSPFGMDDGMSGRYAFTSDSESRVLEGINRLVAALDAWEKRPPRVLMLPGRESEALAVAAGEVLSLGVERFPLHKHVEGLVVAYDLSSQPMEVLDVLAQHRTNRLLWSHATEWTSEGPFASDATTFLYQINHTPWQAGRLRMDPEAGEAVKEQEAPGTARELADAVLNAECDLEAMSDLDALTKLAKAMRRLASDNPTAFGAFRTAGPRLRQRPDSPVKSSRFL